MPSDKVELAKQSANPANCSFLASDIAAERELWQKEVAWKDSRFRLWKARAEKAEARIAELEKKVADADKSGYARGISEVVTAVCDAIGTTPAACAKCPLNHDGECGEKGKYDNTYSYDERDKHPQKKKEARK